MPAPSASSVSSMSSSSSSSPSSSSSFTSSGTASWSEDSSSLASSPMSKELASQTYGCEGNPHVVVRCGHIIPMIRLSPPDTRPDKSVEVPVQDLGQNSLYVPLRTDEVGWEEGGFIWAPKRYWYPSVNLYGGADDHVIGTYRGGPKGYRFINITDPVFSIANESDTSESSSSCSSNKDKTKSKLSNRGVTTTQSANSQKTIAEVLEEQVGAEMQDANLQDANGSDSGIITPSTHVSASTSSSVSSSRRDSSTTDDGHDSDMDTSATTPEVCESPAPSFKKGSVQADKLEAALTAVQQQSQSVTLTSATSQEQSSSTTMLASRVGKSIEMEVPERPIDASRLGGPFQTNFRLKSSSIEPGQTLTLSQSVPSQRFQQARGRAMSKSSAIDYITQDNAGDFAAGWAFEQNMIRQCSSDGQ